MVRSGSIPKALVQTFAYQAVGVLKAKKSISVKLTPALFAASWQQVRTKSTAVSAKLLAFSPVCVNIRGLPSSSVSRL